MVELGVTWEQVDEMTLPQVQALNRHFAKLPPLRVTVAALAKVFGVSFRDPQTDDTGEAQAVPSTDFVELPEFE